MFCPNCGNSNQQPETFCRQCGNFLPDFDKLKSQEISPEQHFIANTVLNAMTGVVSITLAILLYTFFLGEDNTHPLIYITAGFLTAMFFWQAQVFWRTLKLKKQFPGLQKQKAKDSAKLESAETKILAEANFDDFVPGSITEKTTNKLAEKIKTKSS